MTLVLWSLDPADHKAHLTVPQGSSAVKSVATVSTKLWVQISLGPTFYMELKKLSSKRTS